MADKIVELIRTRRTIGCKLAPIFLAGVAMLTSTHSYGGRFPFPPITSSTVVLTYFTHHACETVLACTVPVRILSVQETGKQASWRPFVPCGWVNAGRSADNSADMNDDVACTRYDVSCTPAALRHEQVDHGARCTPG
jgi:hypothetical protein